MATINYTAEHNVAAGYVKVEWPNLTPGDVGQVFECSGLKIGSVQTSGTFNGGIVSLLGSNEVSLSNFTGITGLSTTELRHLEDHDETPFVGAIKPVFSSAGGGGESVNVAVIMLAQ